MAVQFMHLPIMLVGWMAKVLSPGRLMLVVSTAVPSAVSSAVTAVTAFSTSAPSLSLFFFCSSSSSVRGASSTASGLMEAVGLNSGLTDAAVVALSDVVVMDGVVVSACSDSDIRGSKIISVYYLR
jgi:hypothetical protein